jgi:chromosome partitioning protein
MTRVLALVNQKGGSGKTTSSISIACGWARLARQQKREARVLLMDLDAQANATAVMLGLAVATGPRRDGACTTYELLSERCAFDQVALPVALPVTERLPAAQIDVVPSHLELVRIETELISAYQREFRLKKVMAGVVSRYDLIVIDCPASLGLLTLNALTFASEVIIPVDPGYFPLTGLALLNETLQMVQEGNPRLRLAGVLPTMQDRTNLSRDTLQTLAELYGALVLPGIPRRVAVGEANAFEEDIYLTAGNSAAALAYEAVVKELMGRE